MKIIPIAIVIPLNINDSGVSVWMQTRESSDELNGLLEFAGGKLEPGETPAVAAVREFKEEVGVGLDPAQLELLNIYTHSYAEKTVSIYAFAMPINLENLSSSGWHSLVENWRDTLEDKIPAANHNIFDDLAKVYLKGF